MLQDIRIRQRDYLIKITQILTQELELEPLLWQVIQMAVSYKNKIHAVRRQGRKTRQGFVSERFRIHPGIDNKMKHAEFDRQTIRADILFAI